MNTTTSRAWRCSVPGCTSCGAGYGSDRQAADAFRRHLAHGNPTHRQALAEIGGAR